MSENPLTSVPTLEACRLMWGEVDFLPHDGVFPRVAQFVAALAAVFTNGQAIHRTFRFPNNVVFDWYAARNRYYEMGFFEHFWLSPSVQSAIPQKLGELNFYSKDVFEWSSPFMLAGGFAWTLAPGGAYQRHSGGTVDAKRLADGAADELILSDYDSPLLFISHSAWSDFFFDVAWDCTWVLIHPPQRLIHVILATDTD